MHSDGSVMGLVTRYSFSLSQVRLGVGVAVTPVGAGKVTDAQVCAIIEREVLVPLELDSG